MKKLRKILSVISALSLLITTVNTNIYASDDNILSSTELYSNDFDSTEDTEVARWKGNYAHEASRYFTIYSDAGTVEDAMYQDENGLGLYVLKSSTSKSKGAMQFIVDTETEGTYTLSYDMYPAKGTNKLMLVSESDVIEGMAQFEGGTTIMSKTFSASTREWVKVTALVDLDNDKATVTMDSLETGENLYSKETSYTKDLRVFNFFMNGTNICSAANSAIVDNISLCKFIVKPEIEISITDANDEVITDFSAPIKSVKSINIDFGAEINTQTLNSDNIILRKKVSEEDNEPQQTVNCSIDYHGDGVVVLTPERTLDEATAYIIEILDTVEYDEQYGSGKFVNGATAEFSTGDSRVNPTISFVLADGAEETDYTHIACAISQIKVDFKAEMDPDTFTSESLKIIDIRTDEEFSYNGEYLEGEGVYVITPVGSFEDGKTYRLELTTDIKYVSGREILETSYEFKIPSYDYYKQDFNDLTYDDLAKWRDIGDNKDAINRLLNDFSLSPVANFYGATTWPGLGYDGTEALYFSASREGNYFKCYDENGNPVYEKYPNNPDHPNRNVTIPVSKKLETTGVYEFTCDYYPSAGTENFILRGNQLFGAVYNTDNGIRVGQFSFTNNNMERQWCTLAITVDLDSDKASMSLTLKDTGEVIYESSSSYTQKLGVIVVYGDCKEMNRRENSGRVDNIEIKRTTTSAPMFKDGDIKYYAGSILQSDKTGVNYLTDRIEISPEHDIKMGSITANNLYLTEGMGRKIPCRIRYEDGKISLYPTEQLENDTSYVVHVEHLENLDGFTMSSPFDQTFTTSGEKLELNINSQQVKSLEEIIADGSFKVNFTVANSEDTAKTIYFIAAYYNEDYSELIKLECIENNFAAHELVADGEVHFSLPSGTKNVQVAVMDSFGKMTRMCKAIDYR